MKHSHLAAPDSYSPLLRESSIVTCGKCWHKWRLLVSFSLALCTVPAMVQGQSWQTVDDFPAPSAQTERIVSDSAGNLFVAGSAKDETGRNHAVIMKSSDGGGTWTTAADYPALNDPSAPNGALAGFTALASIHLPNGENHLIAAGSIHRDYTYMPLYSIQWLVVRSRDAGATWETINLYTHPAYPQPQQSGQIYGTNSMPTGIAADSGGNIYVSGWTLERIVVHNSLTTNKHWLIRKGSGTPDALQWANVADLTYPYVTTLWEYVTPQYPVLTCVGNNVFVAGEAGGQWHVRRSSDGGASWPIVDNFRQSSTDISRALGITSDSAGNVYVCGFGGQVVKKEIRPLWIVRKGVNGGATWSTLDQFQFSTGGGEALDMIVDGSGNLQVTGTAWSSGSYHWITRQRSAATGTWSSTDDFSLNSAHTAGGRGIAAGVGGNLLTTGWAFDSTSTLHGWLIRRMVAP